MLHVFSTNRVKLVARKLKTTDNLEQREYFVFYDYLARNSEYKTTIFRQPNEEAVRGYFSIKSSKSLFLVISKVIESLLELLSDMILRHCFHYMMIYSLCPKISVAIVFVPIKLSQV
jgi:hypothetical protein